ncbi:transmembrane protein 47-like [Littorina saxatilis]|uniref:Uncharacterized protein n=1 Tax=Littorina saxatilis TaxID=31220 RepID=A0AAN9AS17_9CAEN
MGFKMPHITVIIGVVCMGVALLFQIVGVATAGWLTQNTVGYGLWSVCDDNGNCVDYTIIPDWFDAVRTFGILGLLVIIGAVVVGVLIMFMENQHLALIAAVISFVAAVCLLIEFAVFAGEHEEIFGSTLDYGYSFALTIVAFLLCLAGGVCFFLPKVLG